MPNDVDLVNLCNDIYNTTEGWDHLDQGKDDFIYWALRKLDGVDVVVFRGSITKMDWFRDLKAAPVKTDIGEVHDGFHEGMEKMWAELKPMISQPVMVTGHSLGAARADILCGLMLRDGIKPIRRAVFGEPKPGMTDFCKKVAAIPGASYCIKLSNVRYDYVTSVPLTLWPFDLFERPTPLVYVQASSDDQTPFGLHHIQLYQSAVAEYWKDKK